MTAATLLASLMSCHLVAGSRKRGQELEQETSKHRKGCLLPAFCCCHACCCCFPAADGNRQLLPLRTYERPTISCSVAHGREDRFFPGPNLRTDERKTDFMPRKIFRTVNKLDASVGLTNFVFIKYVFCFRIAFLLSVIICF
jgi:hypothetical protein